LKKGFPPAAAKYFNFLQAHVTPVMPAKAGIHD
jgi:hypothetical protein